MAKVVTLTPERGPEALHMLVCAWVWCPQHLWKLRDLIIKATKQIGLLPSTVMRGQCTKQRTRNVW